MASTTLSWKIPLGRSIGSVIDLDGLNESVSITMRGVYIVHLGLVQLLGLVSQQVLCRLTDIILRLLLDRIHIPEDRFCRETRPPRETCASLIDWVLYNLLLAIGMLPVWSSVADFWMSPTPSFTSATLAQCGHGIHQIQHSGLARRTYHESPLRRRRPRTCATGSRF